MAIQEAKIQFTVRGTSPLMTDNPAGLYSHTAGGGPTRKAVQLPPDEEAENGVYRLPDGACAHAAQAFRRVLLDAGTGFKQGRASYQGILSHVSIEPQELVPLMDPDSGEPLREYEIDIRRVVNKQGNALLKARPKFPRWSATFTISCDPSLIPGDPVKQISMVLEDAGAKYGVGSGKPIRVEKGKKIPGLWFGKFEVVDAHYVK